MQNAYNTPAAQMQRFKEAGINPHAIISKGSSGNASAIAPYQEQATNQAIRPVDITPAGNVLANYYQLKTMDAQARSAQAKAEGDEQYYKARDAWAMIPVMNDDGTVSFEQGRTVDSLFGQEKRTKIGNDLMKMRMSGFRTSQIQTQIKGQEASNAYAEWRNVLAHEFGLTPQDKPEYRIIFNMLTDNGLKLNQAMNSEGLAAGMMLYEKFGDIAGLFKFFGGRINIGGKTKPVSPKLNRSTRYNSRANWEELMDNRPY